MTKGELFKRLENFPDDVPIWFNVDMGTEDGDNWDTPLVSLMADMFMCPGYEGCTHTEPELDCEIVFVVICVCDENKQHGLRVKVSNKRGCTTNMIQSTLKCHRWTTTH